MAKYIDAEKINLPEGFFNKVDNVPKFFEWLDNLPTAEVIEVVRCKDCVHWKHRNFDDKHQCVVFDWLSTENDYCSFAERSAE